MHDRMAILLMGRPVGGSPAPARPESNAVSQHAQAPEAPGHRCAQPDRKLCKHRRRGDLFCRLDLGTDPALAILLDQFGDEKRQLQGLFGIEARIAVGVVAI